MFFSKSTKTSKAVTITDANFKETVLDTDKGVLIDFWAPWCGPCKIMGPIIDELAEEYEGQAIIGKVNVDENPKLSQVFRIRSIPSLVFIKDKKLIENIKGAIPKPNLKEMVEDLIKFEFEEKKV